ncbi:probable protein phosphatase 2C 70 isoform X1 [Lolium rigidum]|uniref:probable protein phosphatase 2C 70 isoform X1 n=1 Tax=Lolium rigidum TaxID=89674 RepID=UPI001F5DCDC5|nr:probable protein phosphatase 2C 70 isoform X1 [Lolium rigidum]
MGVHLSTPKTEKHSQEGEGQQVRYGLACMQGWRTTMEDAHVALPQLDECTSFFGVFDGHGAHSKSDITGKSVAKFCAKYLHVQILKLEGKFGLATAAKKAYLRMDEMMQGHRGWRELHELGEKGQKLAGMLEGMVRSPKGGNSGRPWDGWSEEGNHSDFEGPTCGSTACVAIIRNDQLVVANAGDSRCVISRKGQAQDLSRDHKPDLPAERERIQHAGGFVVAGRVNGSLNLSRAIGDMEMKNNLRFPADRQIVSAEPEVNTVQLSDDHEFIVLACDGIWDCMSSQEVVDFVHEKLRTEDSLSAICEKMLDRCLAPEAGGEGCDNMTVIVVQFKNLTKSAATTSSSEQSAATTEELRPNEPDDPKSPSTPAETIPVWSK